MSVELGDQDDSFIWCLTKHASFTVKSMYSDLMKIGYLPDRCVAWDLKIPLKIIFFVVFKKRGHSNKRQSCKTKLERRY